MMAVSKGRNRVPLHWFFMASMMALSVCEAFVAPVPKTSCTGTSSRPSRSTQLLASEGNEASNDSNWKAPILSVMFAASLAVSSASPAFAVDPSVFTNDYADPLHPQCKRRIEVSRDGTTFHYSGTAVGPKDDPVLRGCSAQEIKEFGIRRGQFDGMIIGDGKISAGDGIHEGVWEPAYSVTGQPFGDVDGIRWNDGNKWTVVQKSWAEQAAEYFFWTYITFSMAAGVKGLYDGIQRKQAEESSLQ